MCPDFNAKISQGSTLILYTYTAESPLAVQMVDNLTKCGYPHIFIIHDGFEDWRAAGIPLETGPDKGAK
jgi:3-mercaptopyruvate sulfurtransferase SseA